MLAKLSLKNIKKSFKDYAIYFFTLILGVAIFYVFNAIDSQTVLLDVTSSTYEIIRLMTNMLDSVSVFVSFILGFLIIYASRFLIKRRKKEFGIYLTLGMSKRKISLILFIETIAIGILSLIVGLALGVGLSQLMSLLVANMFEADMTKFSFIFSNVACAKTLIYFGIMYLIVMIFNTVSVSRCKLIDLLYGGRKSEEVKLKNPVICTIVFIISCLVLARAYYMVTAGIGELRDFDQIFIPIIMGSVSTFLIFWSLGGLLLKIFMSLKGLYYRGLNSFVLRQFSSKINTMVFSMTIICLMLFVTICVLSSSLSIKNSLTKNLDELAPADIQFSKRVDYVEQNITNYTPEKLENYNLNVADTLSKMGVDLDGYLTDIVELDIYNMPGLNLSKSLGNKLDDIMSKYAYLQTYTPEDIVRLGDYNRLARLYGQKEYTLEEDEYLILADFDSFKTIRDESLAARTKLDIFGHLLTPKYAECQPGFIELSSNHINSGIIVVPDDIVDASSKVESYLVANYKGSSKEEKRKTEDYFASLKTIDDYKMPVIETRLAIAEASVGLGALVTFIGLYLGIIFLISSAAILALKELSESADNVSRYRMLRKLGADEHLINATLFKQISIFFAAPLVLAVVHSVFGIKFCTFILESFGTKELAESIMMTVIFLFVIYGSYFLLTYFSSKNIVREKF